MYALKVENENISWIKRELLFHRRYLFLFEKQQTSKQQKLWKEMRKLSMYFNHLTTCLAADNKPSTLSIDDEL